MKIKKTILLVVECGLLMLLFSGCARPISEAIGNYTTELTRDIVSETVSEIISEVMSNIDDYEDWSTTKKQQIEIYTAADNSLLFTITDNDMIGDYAQKVIEAIVDLKYLAAIPSDAKVLYSYVLMQEDLDSERPVDERPLLEALRNTLYKRGNRYYMAVQFEDKTWYVSLSNAIGDYLIKLAEGKIEPNADFEASDDTLHEYEEKDSDTDYNGIASVSKKQKIEVLSHEDSSVIRSITDMEEIVKFLQNQRTAEWKSVSSIPSNAQETRAYVRYAESRRTFHKQLTEQYRDVLYVNSDGYYLETIIADNGQTPSLDESKYFKIPDEVGEYLIQLN